MPSPKFPDVSVIVCSYNHAMWLERCIRSLLNQEFIAQDNFEIMIIDDGSTDETEQILKKFELIGCIKLYRNERNLGLPRSLNIAIQNSLGRYVVRVDSDDYVSRQFLYLMKLFLDLNREYQGVAVDYIEVDSDEQYLRKVNCSVEEIACGVMYRRECLFEIGLYDLRFRMREGHDLRKRFNEKFRVARLEYPLYKYRKHANNRSSNKAKLKVYDELLLKSTSKE